MHTFYIQIVTEKEIENAMTVDEHRMVPTHYLKLLEYETKMVRIDYKPGSKNFDLDLLKKFVIKSIKKRHKNIVKIEVMNELDFLE